MRLFISLSVPLLFSAAVVAQPTRLVANITHIEDGDTVHVVTSDAQKLKVRVWGIDAPEVCHKSNDRACKRLGQPFGPEAAGRMQALVAKQAITLVCNGKFSKDRAVCQVWLGSVDIGLTLVKEGFAHYDSAYLGDPAYADAQKLAMANRRGLFAARGWVLPKVWRSTCWKGGECPGLLP